MKKRGKKAIACALAVGMLCSYGQMAFAEDAADGKYGGTLTYSPGMQNEQNLGYPCGDVNMLMNTNAAPALETLFRLDSEGNLICWLAESYEVTEDGLQYTIKLRPDVLFHDGTKMDAEAVVWNIQKNMENGKSQFAKIASVEATDELTVTIKMSESDILLLANLAADPSGLIVSPTAVEENGIEWAEKNPVGTGPFVFESWENDVEVVYTRNENYWGVDADGNQLPYLDGIHCIYMTENAVAEAALEAGEVQVWTRADADSVPKFEGREGFATSKSEVPSSNINLVPCLNTDNPTASKEFREAVNHAIDFAAIVEGLFGINCVVTNQNSVEGRIYHNDEIPKKEYDPEKAKELLEQAGYNGEELVIYGDNGVMNEKLLTAMVPYLEAVGIKTRIELLGTGAYFSMLTEEFKDGFLVGYYGYAPHEFGKMYSLASASANLPVANFSMDDETYQMFEDARTSASTEASAEIVRELQKRIYETNLYLISVATTYDLVIQNTEAADCGFCTLGGGRWTPESAYIVK